MSVPAKISLVLLFTVLTSLFMNQGWYRPLLSLAATAGPNSPATVTSDNTNGSTKAWTSPGNVSASDNTYATVTLKQNTSHYINAQNFGFAIPAGATINGITVEIEKNAAAASRVKDVEVKLVKAGVIQTTNKADTTNFWGTTDAYASYGGSADLWGTTWSDTDINNTGFGVVISAQETTNTNTVTSVDHIRITVTYTAAAGVTTSVANGTDPSSVTVCAGSTGQYIDQFSVSGTGSGSATLSGVTITFSDYTDVNTVYVKNDANTVTYGTGTPTSNTYSLTLSSNITVTAGSTTPYRIYVDTKSTASASLTARVTDIVVTGTKGTINDSGSATFTFDTSAPAIVGNFTATSGQNAQVPLSWTNPTDTGLAEVLVKRKTGSYPTGHADASATTVYDNTSPTSGGAVNTTDTTGPPVNGTTYYYAVYSRDACGNWNDTTTGGQNAATATPAAAPVNGTTVGAMTFPTVTASSISVQSAYSGDADNNNSCVIAWGTDGSTYPNSLTTTKGSGVYTATANGLNASTTYYFRATYTDSTGLTGSPSTGSQATSAAAGNPMLHNSGNLGNTYGTWGTAYDCSTCHNKNTTNIKRVSESIATPIGNRTVTFLQISGSTTAAAVMGNDQRTAFQNASRNVCEVCHHQTVVHNYSSSKVGADKNHKSANNKDCTGCHAHRVGFKATCDTCHGNPPVATTLGGPNGLVNPATTVLGAAPTDPGAHDKHVTTQGMSCNACHNNNTDHQGSNVLIGFAINGTNVPGFAGTVPATPYSTYSGNSAAAKPTASSEASTLVRNTASTANSCNVYCHGNWSGSGGNTNPRWAGTGQANCGTCHGATAALPPATGNHTTHAGSAGGGYGYSCTKCHPNAWSGSTVNYGHLDGNVQWRLSSAASNGLVGTSAAAYKTLNSSATGAVAPSGSYGSCANIYCHSNAQGSTGSGNPSSFASPSWGGAPVGCGDCHLDFSSSASATGDHVKHAQTYGYACNQCHNGYTATTVAAATHVNRSINLDFAAGNATTTTYSKSNSFIAGSAVYGSCSTSYCHSTANGPTGTGAITYATPTWGSTTMNCGSCHKNMYSDATAPGSHVTHAQNTAGNYNFACSVCHGGYTNSTVPTGVGRPHVDKFINVSTTGLLANGNVYSKTSRFAPNLAYGTCSNTYCHSTGQSTTGGTPPTYATPTWGGTLNCGSCHLNMSTNGSATGDHVKHAGTTGSGKYGCVVCHSGYTATTVATATHVNQTIELGFTGNGAGTAYSQGSGAVGNNFGYCSTSKCHGQGYPIWGGGLYSATVTCENCHGSAASNPFYSTATGTPGAAPTKVTAASDSKVGAHLNHLTSSLNYSSDVACTECHVVPTLANMTSHFRSGTATVTFGTLATKSGTLTSVYSAGTCTNVYCHGDSLPQFSTTQPSFVWNTTGYLGNASAVGNGSTTRGTGDCAACHCYPPADASTHQGKAASSCNGCHTHVSTTGTSFLDATKHIDGTVDATGGDCLGCHSATKGVRQAVVGQTAGNTGDDFVRASRHIKNTTVKNVDCIICHAEGDTGSTETSVSEVGVHQNGTVKLRNVDAQGNPGTAGTNYWNWPGRRNGGTTITSADRDNMDRFCVACHDSDGALTIAVNSAGTGVDTGASVTRRLTPFNPSDGGTPLNVKSQFNSGNAVGSAYASHHNLNIYTKRYTAAYATGNSTKGGWTGTSVDGVAMTWDTGLHCSDCHLNESNAHGARSATRMLRDKNGADAAATNTNDGTATFVCYRCHLSTVYNYSNVTVTGKARIEHDSLDNVPFTAGSYADNGIVCLNCHKGGGVNDTGGIHGNNRSITTLTQGATKSYRFMFGAQLGYNISDANWSTTTAPTCYTASSTWGGSCTKHDGSAGTGRIGTPNYSRPLQ
jgi:predicted CxxxxCH...CXXCH cytochrome family protein